MGRHSAQHLATLQLFALKAVANAEFLAREIRRFTFGKIENQNQCETTFNKCFTHKMFQRYPVKHHLYLFSWETEVIMHA